ncbi:MAG: diacylglycerol kinase family lipid kinase [Oscillospiraceae bacterium]|nr:diacylglycerol kinase family lipid kinase [Oscillospiraceae bacterium]
MKKMFFLYNPHSGKGQISSYLAEIIDIFTKGGYDVTAHPTQFKGDACESVKQFVGSYDVIACSGGDGTLNEVIMGVMDGGWHKPIGYIPAGTMNDFSSNLGISKYMPDAASIIANGVPQFVDIGGFNREYFTYVAAFGVFTSVSYATDQQKKNELGVLAYIIEALKNIDIETRYNLTIECNGQKITDSFIYGMVANSFSIGGIKGLAGNDVSINDGLFEGIFIKAPKTIVELSKTLNALIKHEFDSPYFYYFKSDNFHFTAETPVPWTIDGEYGGDAIENSISVYHNAIKFIAREIIDMGSVTDEAAEE